MKALHAGTDLKEAHLIGVFHGAASKDRKTVTGEVDHIDVACPHGHAFFNDASALVDEGINGALNDLGVGEFFRRDALGFAVCR